MKVRVLYFANLRERRGVAEEELEIEPGTTLAGGNSHVSIYAVVCGMPVETEIFVPILQR